MRYGFTPGAGATYIVGDRIGEDLARESLLSGEQYSGREWRERGVGLATVPRAEMQRKAMVLARQMARASRGQLMRLKEQLNQGVHDKLAKTYELELAMHAKTFVGQAATLGQIEKGFQEVQESPEVSGDAVHVQVENESMDSDMLSGVSAGLRRLLAHELQMRESDIDDNSQFVDLGLDSISGVTWVRKINEKYHTSIEAARLYSYPTLSQLSGYVKEEAEKQGRVTKSVADEVSRVISKGASPQKSAARVQREKLLSRRSRKAWRFSSPPAERRSAGIAVIGMAGQFPQAKNLQQYWANLAQWRNCISEVPRHRWDVNAYYRAGEAVAGKTNSQWVGALEEYDCFDPLFFNISPTEAASMDPQQRLFLQACWHSVESAGYDARRLSGSKCGVFVGCASGSYQQLSREHQLSAHGFTGNAMSILGARISYFLNLQGPCISLDTACSSSLVAIANACDSLISGASDVALAGGVYVMAGPEMHIMTSQAGMLSPQGRCYTFDQRADGFVPGEAVGVVLLKRLADAERDEDIICGVIEGWGVNQDGKTNGITAPNPDSQTRLEQEVYEKYHINPEHFQLIETHGTGTKLGDPIEVEGLKQAFKKYTEKKEYCALGSVKSNIGHCLTAAGIAGVVKVLLALQHKQLPPTINFEQLNEHIQLKDSPFYINDRLREWELKGAEMRQAAISSFGFSGTNVHLVIGEYRRAAEVRSPVTVITQDTKVVVVLSARTAEQLQQKAEDLLNFMREQRAPVELMAMAYTLQVGREAMEVRLGFVVSSVEQLTDKVQAYVDGEREIEDFYQGEVRRSKESISIISQDDEIKEAVVGKWMAARKLSKLVEMWVKGVEVEWSKLYGEVKPRRISLPTYPFAKERYWVKREISEQNRRPHAGARAVLHPLLQRNTSDLREQRYSSTFSGEEFFLADHGVAVKGEGGEEKVLPGVAYVEMARAAVEEACPEKRAGGVLELQNVVWAQPLVVSGEKQVHIALRGSEEGEEIEYEIYSGEAGEEVVHCQGSAVWSEGAGDPAKLEVERLKAEMGEGRIEGSSVYGRCAGMGLKYGPGLQAIRGVDRGKGQVVAELRLPGVVEETWGEYVLHPSLMDGALQAAVGLMEEGRGDSTQAWLPYAVERMRIVKGCTREMWAWVRYAGGSGAGEKVVKLDVDVSDEQGNVCVEMRGFSWRVVSKAIRTTAGQGKAVGTVLMSPSWQARGVEVTAEGSDDGYAEHHVMVCELAEVDSKEVERLLPHSRCVGLQAGEGKSIAERYSEYAVQSFAGIQSILRGKPEGKVLVQIVVGREGEQAVLAGLSGLLKTAGLENPQLMGQVILVKGGTRSEELAVHLQEEKRGVGVDGVIRYEGGKREVLCWEELGEEGGGKAAMAFRDGGVYLITGGLGGLGVLFAKEIVKQTRQGRVIVTGRSGLNGGKQARLEGLRGQGERVSYRQVDLGNMEEVKGLIAGIGEEYGQLNGILHSAGMITDQFILKKGSAEFREVLMPKVRGTYNLDEASREEELDFFVLFSSIAGAMGNVGQADYASANGFMDQFAGYRNERVKAGQRQGKTRSINWPLWQAGGMRIDDATLEWMQQRTGMQAMQTATGMEAFYRSLASSSSQIMPLEGLQPEIAAYLQKAHLLRPGCNAETAAPEAQVPISLEQLQQQLKMMLASVLRIDESSIDVDQPFAELGVDSFLGVKLIAAINDKCGTELSSITVFDHPTISELALFVERELKTSHHSIRPPAAETLRIVSVASSYPVLRRRIRVDRTTSGHHSHAEDKIAIVGMSGRFPKAPNLRQYWDVLLNGRNCIEEVPPARWDVKRYYDPDGSDQGKTNSKWLGALDDIDCFDPLFFRISPHEAEHMDPQHRLFLQESYKAFEDAGYAPNALSNRKCGVYLGISTNEYASILSRNGILSASVTSNSFAIAAARIAYYLNLKGPAISIDTACSSSLVAIHLAAQAILAGDIDMALAGGVTLWLTPQSYVAMSQARMFSPVGQCKTFDDSADGIVNSEGVGAVVLKRLKDAKKDNDFIYGVILGSGINQDGKTNGITAPSVSSQIELERGIYAKYKIDPETISYVETHGTGTRLGDPIELQALAAVFKESTSRRNFCALGSVKSNIGHTTSAAGIAGLQKVLLSMQHRTLVPTLNVTTENSHFDFKNSPFYISRETRSWDVASGSLRRAGVSSFGFSGTNAHLVLEEYLPIAEQAVQLGEPAAYAVPLSARTGKQLQQKSRDLLEFIRTAQRPVDLAAVAYTLQVGREAMEQRLGLIVGSVDQLTEQLSLFVAGEKNIPHLYHGQVEPGNAGVTFMVRDDDMQDLIKKWIARRKLSELLHWWVRGLNFDWHKLYGDVKPRRVSLPTYPFAKERYWISEVSTSQGPDSQPKVHRDLRSIEDLINSIGDDTAETDEAAKALKLVV
jgi:acyl transferase domain-containing protein/acyl carrier protein